ncbi:MAG: orotidine-5'-phosphate decarboxylase [Proteobacteria bacterium]|nr:orotidine-5'-phosphate decarboxylase [Pseudomonadota bacterium]
MKAHERLIVALDVKGPDEARTLVAKIGAYAGVWKIGLELLFSGGAELARELSAQGQKVFVDAKLLDISNTVERATANIAAMGAAFLTIHGHDIKTLKSAVAGRGDAPLKLFAVTVLTSLNAADLAEQGIDESPADLALRRAELAKKSGFDGVIASGHEAASIREATGDDFLIVTPGIRPAGADADDQARVMTPTKAIRAGADYLVVGRPITQATDPGAAARAIVEEIEQALV